MCRVVVLGIAGAGKSTLCRQISDALHLPMYQMDKIGWQPSWRMTPDREVNRKHEEIITAGKWVIDGYVTWESMERRCDAADTLILIDQSPWRHLWWAYKRNMKLLFRHNSDLPDGCSKWPLWKMMHRIIHQTRKDALPRLKKLLADRPQKAQFVLRSPRDIRTFCETHLTDAAGQ